MISDKRAFWVQHIADLDEQIRHKQQLPAEIDSKVAKYMRLLNDPAVQRTIREHDAQKSPAERYADALREQADAIEAAESRAALLRHLQQEIATLLACKASAVAQITE